MKEVFRTLDFVLDNIINSDKHKAILENRPKKYKFGALNYGEITGLKNIADGDRWDIIVPGYSYEIKTNTEYKIKDIIGILLLDNGNHKIAVNLYLNGFKEQNCYEEIDRYCKKYVNFTKVHGAWHSITKKKKL